MKKKLLFAGLLSSYLLIAAIADGHAAPIVLSDEDLDAISGKANNFIFSDSIDINLALTGNDQNGNVQLGYYQWNDSHASDVSQVKGGNRFDGEQSSVQAKVVEVNNAIFWGSLGQNALNTTTLHGGSNVAHAITVVGGF